MPNLDWLLLAGMLRMSGADKPAAELTINERRVLELVNTERNAAGLNPLEPDAGLTSAARVKSADMRDNGYFSHNSPIYGSPFDMLKSFNISFSIAAENIARGQTTPESVFKAWMNSQSHRENIMNPRFTRIGVGFAGGAKPYWAQLFTRP